MKVTDEQVYKALYAYDASKTPYARVSMPGIRAALESLDVQVVEPDQVAVNRHGLYAYLLHTGKSSGPYTEALRDELRAALAAADVHNESDSASVVTAPDRSDPNASEPSAETEAAWGVRAPDSGQGETVTADLDGQGRFAMNLRIAEVTPAASGGGSEADGDQGETARDSTGCAYGCGELAAEPQRVTLPDSPTWRVKAAKVCRALWGKDDELASDLAEALHEFDNAQPPTPDAAETDAPHGPTLAAVVKAYTEKAHEYEYGGRPDKAAEYRSLASYIEREAGGDGHE